MYIKHTKAVLNGKTYINHLLVETIKTPQGPRSRTICSLGSLAPRPAAEWLKLATKVQRALTSTKKCSVSGDASTEYLSYRRYYPAKIVDKIVRRLQNRIEDRNESILPSIHELAAEYGAAKCTVLKAIHVLRDRGMVSCHRGSKTSILRPEGAGSARKSMSESARTLAEQIKTEIVNGTWKIGIELPKFNHFRLTHRMSSDSILEALRSLEAEGFVHKRGNKWIAGRSPSANTEFSVISTKGEKKIVLILLPDPSTWSEIILIDRSFYTSLFRSFIYEVEHFGYQVAIGYWKTSAMNVSTLAGETQIREYTLGVAERYAGTLLFFQQSAASLTRWLLHLKRPVVTCDDVPSEKSLPYDKKLFAYCHFDESGAIRLTLENLAARGHRDIACIRIETAMQSAYHGWVNARAETIRRTALGFHPALRVYLIVQKENFWFRKEWWDREYLFHDFLCKHVMRIQQTDHTTEKRALMACAPSLAAVINHPRVTALIAPNDGLARLYLVWLNLAGITVPGDLSLTAFDYDIGSRHIPLTTVDFNMSMLGYQAAHFVLGDIPIKPARNRALYSKCTLIDRGSIGTPNARKMQ